MKTILIKPVVSEKSMKLAKLGLFTFIVDKLARKHDIALQIASAFGVNVRSVKTLSFKEEVKRQRTRRGYFTISGYKKALVGLKKGQKIALFETEETKGESPVEEVKEKKNILKGTKVKIERQGRNKTGDKSSQTRDLKQKTEREEGGNK